MSFGEKTVGNVNIYVLMERGRWAIQLNGKQFGPCPSKENAIQIATNVARRAVDLGSHAEVLLEGHQRFRTVWSSRRTAVSA